MDGFCFLTFSLCFVFSGYRVFLNKLDDASCDILVGAFFDTSKARGGIYLHQFDHIPGVVRAVAKGGYWHADAFSGQKLETSQLVSGSANRDRFIQAIDSHHFELSQDSQSIKGNGGANARNDSIEPIQPLLRVIDFWSMGRDAQIAF